MTQFDQRYQHVETQYNADEINIHQQPLSLTEKQQKRNRSRMLDRVQAIWIDGVLEPSVQGTAQIALALQHKPSAVVTPLWHVLREFDKTGRLSSADGSIVRVYDHSSGEVLILGEPGAGKSTLLLELTRDLLERARRDETYPIPVVFNLSSWAQTRQPLAEWLASELATRYQVPRPLATSWIETDQVLPLLDGLDEVAAPHRGACVEAINTYRQGHGLLPTVVCCRKTDYLALSTRLLLRTAVVVQPLTSQQVESYLVSGGERLEALHQALQEDADLQALATTPLMLNVLTVAYQGMPSEEIVATGSPGSKREQIFATYVQRMLARRGISTRYTPTQIIHWLSWLAWQMKRHNQTEFYIERMQPDWLPKSQLRWLSYTAFVRLGVVLLSGLVVGLIFGLLDGLSYELPRELPSKLLASINITLVVGLRDGLIAGLIFGLLFGLTSRVKTEIKPAEVIAWSWSSIWQRLVKIESLRSGFVSGLIMSLIFWLVLVALGQIYAPLVVLISALLIGLLFASLFGLLVGLVGRPFGRWFSRTLSKRPLVIPHQGLKYFARNSLLAGLIFALFCGLIFGLISYERLDLVGGLFGGLIFGLFGWLVGQLLPGISDKRPLVTSHQGLWHSARTSALVGLIFGILDWLAVGMVRGLVFGLIVGAIFGLVGWLVGQLLRRIPDKSALVMPHQGIWDFARNSLLVGLTFGLLGGLVFGLSKGLADGLISGLVRGLAVGLSSTLTFGLVDWLVRRLANEALDQHSLITPHQNVWHAARRSVWVGLIFGLLGGLLLGLPDRLFDGLIGGAIFGLVFGLMSWLVDQFLRGVHDKHNMLVGLVPGLVSGLFVGLFFGLAVGLFFGLYNGLIFGAAFGAVFVLLGCLIGSLVVGLTSQVKTGEKLVQGNTWQRLVQIESLRNMLGYGLFTVLSILTYGSKLVLALLAGLIVGLVGWLFFGLLSWLISGLSSETLDEHILVSPNQGIRNSARNSVLVGLIFGLVVGLVAGLVVGLLFGLVVGLVAGLVAGLVVWLFFGLFFGLGIAAISGLSVGLPNGGVACIQHAILRLLLWRSGYIPWNYPQFLDYAAERILLRKVGGGYIFLHRLLLDYFAARETVPVLDEATERRQTSTPAPVSPSNVPSEPTVLAVLPDLSAPTISLVPPAAFSEAPHSLPCGHELRTPSARFCSVCGASITMPHTPT